MPIEVKPYQDADFFRLTKLPDGIVRPGETPESSASAHVPLGNEAAFLREAMAIGEVGAWCWDTEENRFFADDVARKMWRLTGSDALSLTRVRSIIHPDDLATVQTAALAARDGNRECHISFRLLSPDGEIRWIRVRARQSETLKEKLIVGVTIDITERKRVETVLSEIENRLQRAQCLGGAVAFECDYLTDSVVAGDAFKALVGLKPSDALTNESLLQRVHPNDRAKLEKEIEICAGKAGPYEGSFRVILPDDSVRWVLWRGESLADRQGTVTHFAGVMVDITSRKAMEDELRRSRLQANARFRELQALYENAPVGLALLDTDFRYIRINNFLAKMNGLSIDQHLGQCIFDILPDIRIREPYMRQVLSTGEPVRNVEVEAATPRDASIKMTFKMHYYPLHDENGAVSGIGVVAEDVTEQRKAEGARELLSRELVHRIKNLFAVISSIVTLSARSESSVTSYMRSVRGRIEALAQAHDLACLQDKERDAAHERATCQTLFRLLLAPYVADSWRSERISVMGCNTRIGSAAATALALAVHEFATNAAKYGSLSKEEGRLMVECQEWDDKLLITWMERGGPPLPGPPKAEGFGSQLAKRSLVHDLGGEVAVDWAREGLTIRITLPREALAR